MDYKLSDFSDSKRIKNEILSAIYLLVMAVIAPLALSQFNNLLEDAHDNGFLLFQFSFFSFVVVAILDILVAWSLKEVFKSNQRILSNIAMMIRIIYTIMLLYSLVPFLVIFSDKDLTNFNQVFTTFTSRWNFALFIFGFHLMILGILFLRSHFLSFILGVFVIISGIGYSTDFILHILIPDVKISISIYTFVGEVLLIFWLPINAIKIEKSNE